MAKIKDTYLANSYAIAHCTEMAGKELTARFYLLRDEKKNPWVDVYIGRKKVFNCNRGFFDAHFTRRSGLKKALKKLSDDASQVKEPPK